jgi:hypothetical protein
MKEMQCLVERVFQKLFGTNPEAEVLLEELFAYTGAEQERVQLAVLKLSDGNPDKLRQNIQAAKIDYRDVLAWAEYPEQMQTGASTFNTTPEVIGAIMRRDKEQYQRWLAEQSDE